MVWALRPPRTSSLPEPRRQNPRNPSRIAVAYSEGNRTVIPKLFGQQNGGKSDTVTELSGQCSEGYSDSFGPSRKGVRNVSEGHTRSGVTLESLPEGSALKGTEWQEDPDPCVTSATSYASNIRTSSRSERSLGVAVCPRAPLEITFSALVNVPLGISVS